MLQNPSSVTFYDIQPQNGTCRFLQFHSTHRALPWEKDAWVTRHTQGPAMREWCLSDTTHTGPATREWCLSDTTHTGPCHERMMLEWHGTHRALPRENDAWVTRHTQALPRENDAWVTQHTEWWTNLLVMNTAWTHENNTRCWRLLLDIRQTFIIHVRDSHKQTCLMMETCKANKVPSRNNRGHLQLLSWNKIKEGWY